MYCEALESLGLQVEGRIHSTRLKNRILAQFEDLREYKEGKDVILAFESNIGEVLTCAASIDYDDEGYILAEAARIIRRDSFNFDHQSFGGHFEYGCQDESTPNSMKTLITMLLRGHSGNEASNPYFKQAMMTISQLLYFNMTKKTRGESLSAYHTQKREPPIAVYIGKMIHSHTRKLKIVEKLSHLGLCISPDCLNHISTILRNTAIEKFEKDNVVYPLNMCHGLFTIGAIDNIDVNPSSSTAMSSFHGTAASLHQKVATNANQIEGLEKLTLSTDKFLKQLPDEYTEIPPFYVSSSAPSPDFPENPAQEIISGIFQEESDWMKSVRDSSNENKSALSWAAYNAAACNSVKDPDISALLPMWRESSKSPAMIRHAINVIIRAVQHLNPFQTPVIAFDQPLYAIGKTIQWNFPNKYGPAKLILMLGPLHTEMAYLSVLGDWFANSGWTTLSIHNADVTHSGVAQSLLSGHGVVRTKYSHQLTACTLRHFDA